MATASAKHHEGDADHDVRDGGHDHGSYETYLKGFILSVVLTVIPFAVIMMGGFESPVWTALSIMGLAVVQIVVHMIYFLHMNSRSDEGWTITAMVFTVVVVVIVLSGSLWVMYHMNANMMPQMNHALDVTS